MNDINDTTGSEGALTEKREAHRSHEKTIRIGISMPPICPNFSYMALKFCLALMFFLGLVT